MNKQPILYHKWSVNTAQWTKSFQAPLQSQNSASCADGQQEMATL